MVLMTTQAKSQLRWLLPVAIVILSVFLQGCFFPKNLPHSENHTIGRRAGHPDVDVSSAFSI